MVIGNMGGDMDVGLFPAWTVVVGFFIGAAIGSFLNVVIYRLPRGMSIAQPVYSFCTTCKKRLTPGELVPLLSWLFQRGRCSCGEHRVSSRYFFVELATGSLWGALWYQHFVVGDDPVRFLAYALFSACLVAAVGTDLAHYIIPDEVNAAMLLIGLGFGGYLVATGAPDAYTWGMPSAVAGALTGWGMLWGLTLFGRLAFGKDAMGHGDIKMMRGVGAVLFPMMTIAGMGIAVIFATIVGLTVVVIRKSEAKKAGVAQDEEQEDEEDYEPESVGSILKCGLGYLLLIDVIGLFIPKLYRSWFGEDPYAVEEMVDEPEVEMTMIPFGPSLAVGAAVAMLFSSEIEAAVRAYLSLTTGN